MAEPSTTAVAASTTVAVGAASLLLGIDVNALIGAFAGASVFVVSAKELSIFERLVYLVVSIVMGYMIGPALADRYGPDIQTSALPAFIAAVAIVSAGLRVVQVVKELDIGRIFPGGRK